MPRSELPPIPNFSSIETEALKHADRRTMILALIGNLVFAWSNNESMFIYVLMALLDTDEPTAAIIFATLNTTRARLDLIQRLATVKVSDPATARALDGLIKRFNSATRMRNEFNHCMYAVNAQGEITHMNAMRIQEGRGGLQFGSVREMNQQRIDEIVRVIEQLKELNHDIWEFLPRLRDHIRSPGMEPANGRPSL